MTRGGKKRGVNWVQKNPTIKRVEERKTALLGGKKKKKKNTWQEGDGGKEKEGTEGIGKKRGGRSWPSKFGNRD